MCKTYKMRRKDRALSEADSWQLLCEAPVGHLGLSDEDGVPYVIPLNHVVVDGDIFFHCAGSGRKLDIMRVNPKVCYEVNSFLGVEAAARACNFSAFFESAIAFGEAYELADADKKLLVLNQLAKKYAPPAVDYEQVSAADTAMVHVVGIKVHNVTGKARPHPQASQRSR